jgi:hypothetical protein
VPYYLAGLSHVGFVKVLLLTAIIRIPSVFVAAAAGAGVMFLSWWQLALLFALLAGFVLVFLRYHDRIIAWSERRVQRQIERDLHDNNH